MLRTLCFLLALSYICIATTPVFAQGRSSAGPPAPVILAVEPNVADGLLTITGTGFGADVPDVTIDSVPLAVLSNDAFRIVASLPPLPPKAYRLTVNTFTPPTSASFSLTIESGDITEVMAGAGLTGGATSGSAQLGVDTTVIQARVLGECTAGGAIRSIKEDGTVTCASGGGVVPTITSADNSIVVMGTTLNPIIEVNTARIQARVVGTCALGSAMRSITPNGAVTCTGSGEIVPALVPGDESVVIGGTTLNPTVAVANRGITASKLAVPLALSGASPGSVLSATNSVGSGIAAKGQNAAGVIGESDNAPGVFGRSFTTSGGAGVHGESNNSAGVFGRSITSSGLQGESTSGVGVFAKSATSSGLHAESTAGTGAFAKSNAGNGLHGQSVNGRGVFGESTTGQGVFGRTTATTGGAAGVHGESMSTAGVYGQSTSASGVFGRTTATTGAAGVHGESISTAGVHGQSTAGAGVFGRSMGPDGVGVWGESTGSNGRGVFGIGNAFGVFGYSAPRIAVQGTTEDGVGVLAEVSQNDGGTGLPLLVRGGTSSNPFAAVVEGNVLVTGNLTVNGNTLKPGGGSWSTLSDLRTKTGIRPLDDALQKMLQLRGVRFQYSQPLLFGEAAGDHTGMVAQEVEQVFPEWVDTAADGYKRIAFRGFEALTVEAMRELRDQLTERALSVESHILRLQKENEALHKVVEELSDVVRTLRDNQGR